MLCLSQVNNSIQVVFSKRVWRFARNALKDFREMHCVTNSQILSDLLYGKRGGYEQMFGACDQFFMYDLQGTYPNVAVTYLYKEA